MLGLQLWEVVIINSCPTPMLSSSLTSAQTVLHIITSCMHTNTVTMPTPISLMQ